MSITTHSTDLPIATFTLTGQSATERGATNTILVTVEVEEGVGFVVKEEGVIVSTSHLKFVPAVFTDPAMAVSHALDHTGWLQSVLEVNVPKG